MGCEGCYISQKEYQQRYNNIKEQAKQYSIDHECTVIIYQTTPFNVSYMEAKAAFENGITPVEYISFLPRTTNE